MKKILMILTTIFLLCGCTKLNSKKYIKLDYSSFVSMLDEYNSFSLVIEQERCSSCESFRKTLKEYLKEEKTVYYINYTELQNIDKLSLSSMVYSLFGENYYTNNNISINSLNTPTIIRVTNGYLDNGSVGVMELDQLTTLLESDLLGLYDYYSFTRKTAANQTFNIVFTDNVDVNNLNNYMSQHSLERLYYLDINSLTENNKTNLLNRINYFLEEDINSLSNNCFLKYTLGSISEYTTI